MKKYLIKMDLISSLMKKVESEFNTQVTVGNTTKLIIQLHKVFCYRDSLST